MRDIIKFFIGDIRGFWKDISSLEIRVSDNIPGDRSRHLSVATASIVLAVAGIAGIVALAVFVGGMFLPAVLDAAWLVSTPLGAIVLVGTIAVTGAITALVGITYGILSIGAAVKVIREQ